MSLEQALADNTTAIQKLTDLMERLNGIPVQAETASTLDKPAKPAGKAKSKPAPEKEAPQKETEGGIDYDTDIKVPVLEIAKQGGKKLDELKAVLASFGVKNAKQLEEAQWADFHDKLQGLK